MAPLPMLGSTTAERIGVKSWAFPLQVWRLWKLRVLYTSQAFFSGDTERLGQYRHSTSQFYIEHF